MPVAAPSLLLNENKVVSCCISEKTLHVHIAVTVQQGKSTCRCSTQNGVAYAQLHYTCHDWCLGEEHCT